MEQKSTLYDKVFGCVIGGAIGDALGGPVEAMDAGFIRKLNGGPVTDFRDYHIRPDDFFLPQVGGSYAQAWTPGTYTDDTYFATINARCIIEKGGRINCDDLADYWIGHLDVNRGWFSVMAAYNKLSVTRMPAREAGACNISDVSSAMCIGPVGVINACNPAQAALDGYDVMSLLHHGHSREAAGALAAAIAEAFKPTATVDSIAQAALDNVPGGKYSRMYAPIKLAIDLARQAADAEELTRLYYEQLNVDWAGRGKSLCGDGRHNESCEALESVSCAIGMFVNAKGDYVKTVCGAAGYGRDCDTIACMAGYLAGAFRGAGAIPERWIKTCLAVNPDPDLAVLAQKLTDTLLAQVHADAARCQGVLAMA